MTVARRWCWHWTARRSRNGELVVWQHVYSPLYHWED